MTNQFHSQMMQESRALHSQQSRLTPDQTSELKKSGFTNHYLAKQPQGGDPMSTLYSSQQRQLQGSVLASSAA